MVHLELPPLTQLTRTSEAYLATVCINVVGYRHWALCGGDLPGGGIPRRPAPGLSNSGESWPTRWPPKLKYQCTA